jgi:hypothetical protein
VARPRRRNLSRPIYFVWPLLAVGLGCRSVAPQPASVGPRTLRNSSLVGRRPRGEGSLNRHSRSAAVGSAPVWWRSCRFRFPKERSDRKPTSAAPRGVVPTPGKCHSLALQTSLRSDKPCERNNEQGPALGSQRRNAGPNVSLQRQSSAKR